MVLGMVERARRADPAARAGPRRCAISPRARPPKRLLRARDARHLCSARQPLGVWQLKWELEDLSFRFLEPELYKRIAQMLDEKRLERERYIANAVDTLARELGRSTSGQITGRPKHIYSIWNKMRKQLDFPALRRARARHRAGGEGLLRRARRGAQPLAADPEGVRRLHLAPKGNLYQSLHTAVVGPGGKTLEVQIRTEEMPQAEYGVTAHWHIQGKPSRRSSSTRRWPGCGSCSPGATKSRSRSGTRSTTRSTCSRRRAR